MKPEGHEKSDHETHAHRQCAANSPVLSGPNWLEKQSHLAVLLPRRPASRLWLECNQNCGKHNEKIADSTAGGKGKPGGTPKKMVAWRERPVAALLENRGGEIGSLSKRFA